MAKRLCGNQYRGIGSRLSATLRFRRTAPPLSGRRCADHHRPGSSRCRLRRAPFGCRSSTSVSSTSVPRPALVARASNQTTRDHLARETPPRPPDRTRADCSPARPRSWAAASSGPAAHSPWTPAPSARTTSRPARVAWRDAGSTSTAPKPTAPDGRAAPAEPSRSARWRSPGACRPVTFPVGDPQIGCARLAPAG